MQFKRAGFTTRPRRFCAAGKMRPSDDRLNDVRITNRSGSCACTRSLLLAGGGRDVGEGGGEDSRGHKSQVKSAASSSGRFCSFLLCAFLRFCSRVFPTNELGQVRQFLRRKQWWVRDGRGRDCARAGGAAHLHTATNRKAKPRLGAPPCPAAPPV